MPPENLFQLLQPQMATTQAVSTGVAHDEINSLIYKKKEIEPSLLDFIRKSVSTVEGLEPEDTSYGRAIAQLVEESYSPHIKQMDLEGFKRYGSVFKDGEPRAFFKTDRYGSPRRPDTVFTTPGNIDELIAELSHQMQYGPLSPNQVGELEYRRREEEKEFGQDVYKRFDTMEGEAHNIGVPILNKRFKTLLDSLSAPITVESLFQNR